MEYSSPLLFLYVLHLSHFLWLPTRTIFLFYEPVCACACVFNSMCVLERATDRPTPTERWCVVYDFSRESRCILSFPGVRSGQLPRSLLTSLAHPKPLHRPRVLPAQNGQRRSRESVPHSCPGRADATSHWRKSDGCFVRPTYCWVYVI